jgi:hypothetical protein
MDDSSRPHGGLPDVHAVSLGDLTALGDEPLNQALAWLLRPCGGAIGRTWSNDNFQPGL